MIVTIARAWPIADFSAQKENILNRLLINFTHSNSNTYSSACMTCTSQHNVGYLGLILPQDTFPGVLRCLAVTCGLSFVGAHSISLLNINLSVADIHLLATKKECCPLRHSQKPGS